MTLVSLDDMPVELKRAYRMFELISGNWNPTMPSYEPASPQKEVSVNEAAYYSARRCLVEAVRSAMRTDDPVYHPEFIRGVMKTLKIDSLDPDDIRFYLELSPPEGNLHKQVRMHVFYGGAPTPIDKGHAHVMLYINPDARVASVSYRRLPVCA